MADQNNPTNAELNAMSDEQLEDLAHARGITVTGTGGEAPERSDYIAALATRDSAKEAQNIAAAKNAKLDETVAGGNYINAQGQHVNAHGQRLGEDGKPLDGSAPKTNAEPMI